MTDEQMGKKHFVENKLAETLSAATGGYVWSLDYGVFGAEEVVHVYTCGVSKALVVNVTSDSLWAIAKDVMRAVADRYE